MLLSYDLFFFSTQHYFVNLAIYCQSWLFYFGMLLDLQRSGKDTLMQLLMLASPVATARLSKLRNEH